jgi:hypothetical protein
MLRANYYAALSAISSAFITAITNPLSHTHNNNDGGGAEDRRETRASETRKSAGAHFCNGKKNDIINNGSELRFKNFHALNSRGAAELESRRASACRACEESYSSFAAWHFQNINHSFVLIEHNGALANNSSAGLRRLLSKSVFRAQKSSRRRRGDLNLK